VTFVGGSVPIPLDVTSATHEVRSTTSIECANDAAAALQFATDNVLVFDTSAVFVATRIGFGSNCHINKSVKTFAYICCFLFLICSII
jgi:hypothetical protein